MPSKLWTAILLPTILTACAAEPTKPPAPPPPTASATPSTQPIALETKSQRDARMSWWRDARFGMFIHWGVYSVPAGTYDGKQIPSLGEWIMLNGKIPVAEYAKYAEQFNPQQFDAEQWVTIAQNAGMKYIVITAKHHDGFAMFHTKVDSYNIYDATPFKRDPLAELAAACQRHGMHLGFYYSQCQDWHHPGGQVIRGAHWDPAQDGDFDSYLHNVAEPQVKELLTNYGPVSVFWFDTPAKLMTPPRVALFPPLLALQPQIIVNNRLGTGFKGDTETPEQHIPPTGYPDARDWETCMTINDTWGYKSYDTNFKTTQLLLRNLIDIASKGGNYLLNVGPTSEGIIPAPEVQRITEMGQWLKTNGEAIYGSHPTIFGPEAGSYSTRPGTTRPVFTATWNWRCTTKPGKIYIHIFNWPAGKFDLTGVKEQVTKAYLLADRQPLTVTQSGSDVSIALPATAPDANASVLCLEVPTTP